MYMYICPVHVYLSSGQISYFKYFVLIVIIIIVNQVNLQQLLTDGIFGAVHRAVAILNKFHQPLSITTKNQFEATPHR